MGVAMVDDHWFRQHNRSQTVTELPGFPFKDYEEARRALSGGEGYYLGIDYSAANRLAPFVRRSARLVYAWVGIVPFLGVGAGVAGAIWTRDLRLLWAIPIVVAALLTGSPIVHKSVGCGCLPWAWIAALLGFLISAVKGHVTPAWLWGTYAATVFWVQYYYRFNANAVEDAALQSEAVLIYLIEQGAAVVRETRKRSGLGGS